MSIELNQESFEFSQAVLQMFQPFIHKQKKNQENTEQQMEDIKLEKMDSKTKYSLDYEKFNQFLDESDSKSKLQSKEQQEMEKMIQQNPYLSQMACTHDRRKEREIFEKPTKEKLDNAEYFKNEGNISIKNKDFDKASYFYQKALIHFDYTFPDTPDENKRFDLLREQCFNNMALCKFYQNQFEECLVYCEQVLKLNPKNIKALFRKGNVFYEQDQFDKCQSVISQLVDLVQSNLEISQLQNKLQEKRNNYNRNSKLIYKKIFNQENQ